MNLICFSLVSKIDNSFEACFIWHRHSVEPQNSRCLEVNNFVQNILEIRLVIIIIIIILFPSVHSVMGFSYYHFCLFFTALAVPVLYERRTWSGTFCSSGQLVTIPIFCCLFFACCIYFLDYPYLIKLTQIKSSQRWFRCICYQGICQIVTGSVIVHSPINILVNPLMGTQLRKKITLLVRFLASITFSTLIRVEK